MIDTERERGDHKGRNIKKQIDREGEREEGIIKVRKERT